ncbi:uncharacterized protein FFB14_15103 [Fusarium fujikuroi]|nr:uncharacterized protein FFB14_15103 [Fusarium fujikuroi]
MHIFFFYVFMALATSVKALKGNYSGSRHLCLTGNLLLDFGHQTEEVSNYERWLDTLEGTTGISYDINGVTYTREVVANFPLGVIAARFTANKDGSLNIGVSLEGDRGVISNISNGGANNIMTDVGSSGAYAIPFTAGLRVVSNDAMIHTLGTIKAEGSSLNITKASTVDLFLDVETSFQWKSESDWMAGLVNKLDQAVKRGDSKFTVNINTEMNYWLAETTDLTETLRPLWDLMYRSRDRGSEVATKIYGCPGYVSHHNLDLWGDSAPHDSGTAYSIWPSSNLWLSQHMMEHYRFTGNKTFLREKAWPLFKDIAAFCDC